MSSADAEEDPTRKQRREQARAERKALEEAEAAGAARRRRLQLLGGTIGVVVVAIVIVLIATGGSSGNNSSLATGKSKVNAVTKEVASLIGGIPQQANALGNPRAPITLKYFGDLECPICKAFTLNSLPTIINKWVRPGTLRIEYHSLETATREPEVFRQQQVAAYAAGKQDKAWYFIETFYHEQGEEDSGYVNESYLQGIAKQVPGLNLSAWMTERGNKTLAGEVEEDAQAANNEGFTGTPSFLIGRSGGAMEKLGSGALEPPTFDSAIEKLLKAS